MTAATRSGDPSLARLADAILIPPFGGRTAPGWVLNALGGIAQTIDPMVACAAKTVALSGLRILEDDSARAAARREFVERTGGGVGGSSWIAPLCDYPPPIDFRWPTHDANPAPLAAISGAVLLMLSLLLWSHRRQHQLISPNPAGSLFSSR